MLAKSSERHGPSGIEQVVHDHEEERSQTDAQEKHEGKQPGIGKFFTADRKTDERQDSTNDDENHRHIAPFREIEWRRRVRFWIRSHRLIANWRSAAVS